MKSFKTYDEQIDILSNSGLLPKYTDKLLLPNINGPAVFHISSEESVKTAREIVKFIVPKIC